MDAQPKSFRPRAAILLVFALALFSILAYKAVSDGWFTPQAVIPPNNQPTFIFFNRHKGCECAVKVFRQANEEIAAWTEEDRAGAPLIFVDLDIQTKLEAKYAIVRAPTLLLLDANGQEVYRQDEVVSDTQVFDLEQAERVLLTFTEP